MEDINEEVIIRAKLNSIGSTKKETLKVRKKEISKRVLATLCAILMTISISACSTTKTSTQISNYDIDRDCVNTYIADTVMDLTFFFECNGMQYYGEFDNSVEEYIEIKDQLNEGDIVIYYDRFGEEECGKILEAFGYNDINDYMLKNGYVDSNGKPSIEILRYATYERITQAMKGNSK